MNRSSYAGVCCLALGVAVACTAADLLRGTIDLIFFSCLGWGSVCFLLSPVIARWRRRAGRWLAQAAAPAAPAHPVRLATVPGRPD